MVASSDALLTTLFSNHTLIAISTYFVGNYCAPGNVVSYTFLKSDLALTIADNGYYSSFLLIGGYQAFLSDGRLTAVVMPK